MSKKVVRASRMASVITIVLAVTLLTGCAGLQSSNAPDNSSFEDGARVAEVKTGNISVAVSGSSSFVPVKATSLFFNNLTGPLKKLYVKTDDRITVGDPVAEIGLQSVEKEIEKQKMSMELWTIRKMQNAENVSISTRSLQLVQMNLDQAIKKNEEEPTEENAQEVARQRILYEQAVSNEKNAKWSRSIGETQAKLDEKELVELNEKLSNSVLTSPVDGIVTFVENLTETEMVNSGRVIARIVEPSNIVLQMLTTDARYIQNVKNGVLTINSEKYDVELYTPQAGDLLDESASNRIYVKFGANMPIIDLESITNASLEIQKSNVLLIPKAALRDLNGKTVVDVNKGNLLETVEVVRGVEQDSFVEIISGLEAGQIVAVQ